MQEDHRAPHSPASAGVRGMLGAALGFAETRARIAANEVEEQLLRLSEICVWGVAAALFFCLAVLFASLCIVFAFWEMHRLLAAGLLTTLYLGAGGVSVLMLRSRLAARPRFLAATMRELAKDKKDLGQI